MKGAPEHPGHVGVDCWSWAFVRKAGHSSCGIWSNPRQPEQGMRLGWDHPGVILNYQLRQLMQVLHPAVVTQPFPGFTQLTGRCGGKRIDVRKQLQKAVVVWLDPSNLGLLQHKLGYQDAVRISGPPPGQVPSVSAKPAQKRLAESGCVS